MSRVLKLSLGVMGCCVLIALAGFFFFSRWQSAAGESEAHQASKGIQQLISKTGMPVYYMQAPDIPMVDLVLMLDAGAIHDGDKAGMALLTNELLDQGTSVHQVDEIAEALAQAGALFNHSVTQDYANLKLRSLTNQEKLAPAFSLFLEILEKASFDEAAFKRKQAQLLAELQYEQQQPGVVAARLFNQLLYPTHPYGQSSQGTLEAVQTLTPADVKAFYQQHYGQKNAVLAVVGDVSAQQALDMADAIGAILQTREAPEQILATPQPTQAASKAIDFPSEQTHVYYGALGIKRGDPDYFPLYVGNHILGGSSVSELFNQVREEQGLAYSIYSYFEPRQAAGPFLIKLQTRNNKKDQAIATVKKVLDNFIEKGPTAAQLMETKQYMSGNFALRVSSNREKVGYLAMIGYYGLPIDYLATFKDNIEKVQLTDIKRAFKQHLDSSQMITVTVGQS